MDEISEESFHLLDVIGGSCISAMHPTRPIVAYNSGNEIINDKIFRMHDYCL
jgi:hypothetical protein